MDEPKIALKLGEYTLLRDTNDRLWVAHTSVKEPVELEQNLLLLLFKRVLRESMGL